MDEEIKSVLWIKDPFLGISAVLLMLAPRLALTQSAILDMRTLPRSCSHNK